MVCPSKDASDKLKNMQTENNAYSNQMIQKTRDVIGDFFPFEVSTKGGGLPTAEARGKQILADTFAPIEKVRIAEASLLPTSPDKFKAADVLSWMYQSTDKGMPLDNFLTMIGNSDVKAYVKSLSLDEFGTLRQYVRGAIGGKATGDAARVFENLYKDQILVTVDSKILRSGLVQKLAGTPEGEDLAKIQRALSAERTEGYLQRLDPQTVDGWEQFIELEGSPKAAKARIGEIDAQLKSGSLKTSEINNLQREKLEINDGFKDAFTREKQATDFADSEYYKAVQEGDRFRAGSKAQLLSSNEEINRGAVQAAADAIRPTDTKVAADLDKMAINSGQMRAAPADVDRAIQSTLEAASAAREEQTAKFAESEYYKAVQEGDRFRAGSKAQLLSSNEEINRGAVQAAADAIRPTDAKVAADLDKMAINSGQMRAAPADVDRAIQSTLEAASAAREEQAAKTTLASIEREYTAADKERIKNDATQWASNENVPTSTQNSLKDAITANKLDANTELLNAKAARQAAAVEKSRTIDLVPGSFDVISTDVDKDTAITAYSQKIGSILADNSDKINLLTNQKDIETAGKLMTMRITEDNAENALKMATDLVGRMDAGALGKAVQFVRPMQDITLEADRAAVQAGAMGWVQQHWKATLGVLSIPLLEVPLGIYIQGMALQKSYEVLAQLAQIKEKTMSEQDIISKFLPNDPNAIAAQQLALTAYSNFIYEIGLITSIPIYGDYIKFLVAGTYANIANYQNDIDTNEQTLIDRGLAKEDKTRPLGMRASTPEERTAYYKANPTKLFTANSVNWIKTEGPLAFGTKNIKVLDKNGNTVELSPTECVALSLLWKHPSELDWTTVGKVSSIGQDDAGIWQNTTAGKAIQDAANTATAGGVIPTATSGATQAYTPNQLKQIEHDTGLNEQQLGVNFAGGNYPTKDANGNWHIGAMTDAQKATAAASGINIGSSGAGASSSSSGESSSGSNELPTATTPAETTPQSDTAIAIKGMGPTYKPTKTEADKVITDTNGDAQATYQQSGLTQKTIVESASYAGQANQVAIDAKKYYVQGHFNITGFINDKTSTAGGYTPEEAIKLLQNMPVTNADWAIVMKQGGDNKVQQDLLNSGDYNTKQNAQNGLQAAHTSNNVLDIEGYLNHTNTIGINQDDAIKSASGAIADQHAMQNVKDLATQKILLNSGVYAVQQAAGAQIASTQTQDELIKSGLANDANVSSAWGKDHRTINNQEADLKTLATEGVYDQVKGATDPVYFANRLKLGDTTAMGIIEAVARMDVKDNSAKDIKVGVVNSMASAGITANEIKNTAYGGQLVQDYHVFYDNTAMYDKATLTAGKWATGTGYATVTLQSPLSGDQEHAIEIIKGNKVLTPDGSYADITKIVGSHEDKDAKGYTTATNTLNALNWAVNVLGAKDPQAAYAQALKDVAGGKYPSTLYDCVGAGCAAATTAAAEGGGGGGRGGGGGSNGGSGAAPVTTQLLRVSANVTKCDIYVQKIDSLTGLAIESEKSVGLSDTDISLEKGDYNVTVRKEGYNDTTKPTSLGSYPVTLYVTLIASHQGVGTYIDNLGGLYMINENAYLYLYCMYMYRRTSNADWASVASITNLGNVDVPADIVMNDVLWLYYMVTGQTAEAAQLKSDKSMTITIGGVRQ